MSAKISERTLPLQGLRVLLMLGIVMLHTYHKPILGTGRECVSFFIIVSGFLYRDALPWKQYMRKKAIGIFPVFWIVLMLSEIICLLRGGNNIGWSIIPHILLLQSWYPNLYFSFDYVGVAWFVSSLMFCYVVSPMLYKRIRMMGMKSSCFCMAFLFMCLAVADSFRVPVEDDGYAFREWLCYANPLYCLMEYMIGMLLWKVSEAVSCCRLNAFYEPVAACLIAGYVYAIWVNVGGIYVVHTVMIFLIYKYRSKVMDFLFANRLVVWLSAYVMFIYMSHQSLTLNCLQSRVDSKIILVILCFVCGIIYGMFYRRCIAPKIKSYL